MNFLQKNNRLPRAPGVDHLYRSSFVIWYNNGALACGPRVREIREGLIKTRGRGFRRRPNMNIRAKMNMPRIFGDKWPF